MTLRDESNYVVDGYYFQEGYFFFIINFVS